MHFSLKRLVLTGAAAAALLGACAPSALRSNPDDIEREAPALSSGECESASVIDHLLVGPDQLAVHAPKEGTVIALEGVPQPQVVCTLMACESACCNECGFVAGCAYSVESGGGSVCLSHPDFECGGMDCALSCSPFSSDPKHRYRFVGKLVHASSSRQVTLEVQKFCRID